MEEFTAVIDANGITIINSRDTDNSIVESPAGSLKMADDVLNGYRLRRLEGWQIRYEREGVTLTARCVRVPSDFDY